MYRTTARSNLGLGALFAIALTLAPPAAADGSMQEDIDGINRLLELEDPRNASRVDVLCNGLFVVAGPNGGNTSVDELNPVPSIDAESSCVLVYCSDLLLHSPTYCFRSSLREDARRVSMIRLGVDTMRLGADGIRRLTQTLTRVISRAQQGVRPERCQQ